MKKRIKSISVLQMGKILALAYLGLALIMLPFFLIGALFNPKNAIIPLIMIILYPILGFIGGIVMAFAYNLSAKLVGGLVFTVEDVQG